MIETRPFYLVFSEKAWRRLREAKKCAPFTDEELQQAVKNGVPIKRGWVWGCGSVEMFVDVRLPILVGS